MLTKTRAIVLKSFKYGEQSLIVDLFTKECGRLTFIVRIPKSSHGKIKKQFFQPATILDLEFDYRTRLSMQKMKEVTMAVPYASLTSDPYKLAIVLFLCEFLSYATRTEQENTPLYNYIETGLRWLDEARGGFSNFHIVFLARLALFLGFCPNLETAGLYFDLRSGCFVNARPLHPDFLTPDEADKVVLLMRMDYPTMRLFTMSRAQRWRCLEVIVSFYRLHIPDFPEIKSLDVLRDLFS